MTANTPAVCCSELLDDLESRIDVSTENALEAEWKNFLDGNFTGDVFTPARKAPSAPGCEWPEIMINDAIDDYELMLASQLRSCSNRLENGSGTVLSVRSNYGVGIMSSIFGAELFFMERHLNCLPNSRHLAGGLDGIKRLLDKGIPDLEKRLGAKVFSMGEKYRESFKPYPKISRHVHVYHPDLQGPMDICELLWGSDIFVDLYEEPELIHDFLDLITRTYIAFMKRWWEIFPPNEVYNVHWGFWHTGNIILRDDSAMNLSPEMYREFIFPYNQTLLHELGGGGIHACGKVDHWLPVAAELQGLKLFNISQPEYNDMERVYQNCIDKGIPLLSFSAKAAREALAQGRDLRGMVHCDNG